MGPDERSANFLSDYFFFLSSSLSLCTSTWESHQWPHVFIIIWRPLVEIRSKERNESREEWSTRRRTSRQSVRPLLPPSTTTDGVDGLVNNGKLTRGRIVMVVDVSRDNPQTFRGNSWLPMTAWPTLFPLGSGDDRMPPM